MQTFFNRGSESLSCASLTFDDGPSLKTTKQILNILEKFSVSATFFVTGENALRFPYLVQEIVKRGHEIGNHSFRHVNLLSVPLESVSLEIEITNRVIFELTGHLPLFFRPPFGEYNDNIAAIAGNFNMIVALWGIDPGDWSNPGSEKIAFHVTERLKNGEVVLLHDQNGLEDDAQLVSALPFILKEAEKREIQLIPLRHLYHLSKLDSLSVLQKRE